MSKILLARFQWITKHGLITVFPVWCAKAQLGLDIEFRQTNAEFQLIDWIHEARERAAGIVINPAALTHTSVAVLARLVGSRGTPPIQEL
jgi:3-dehydroquinate dehydratase